jgi:hypothetical protein
MDEGAQVFDPHRLPDHPFVHKVALAFVGHDPVSPGRMIPAS